MRVPPIHDELVEEAVPPIPDELVEEGVLPVHDELVVEALPPVPNEHEPLRQHCTWKYKRIKTLPSSLK